MAEETPPKKGEVGAGKRKCPAHHDLAEKVRPTRSEEDDLDLIFKTNGSYPDSQK